MTQQQDCKCRECGMDFPSPQELQRHSDDMHRRGGDQGGQQPQRRP